MAAIVSMLRNLLGGNRAGQVDDDAGWISDPLCHHDLARMDQRMLGDLPMPGFARPRPVSTSSRIAALPMKRRPDTEELRTAC